MKIIILIFGFFGMLISCENEIIRHEDNLTLNDIIEQMNSEPKNAIPNFIECPKGHQDSIIPIIYGYPSEELFAKSDSGLLYLGGCQVFEDSKNFWCRIHEISF